MKKEQLSSRSHAETSNLRAPQAPVDVSRDAYRDVSKCRASSRLGQEVDALLEERAALAENPNLRAPQAPVDVSSDARRDVSKRASSLLGQEVDALLEERAALAENPNLRAP